MVFTHLVSEAIAEFAVELSGTRTRMRRGTFGLWMRMTVGVTLLQAPAQGNVIHENNVVFQPLATKLSDPHKVVLM